MLTMPPIAKRILLILCLGAIAAPAGASWDPAYLADISTANLYGIPAALKAENPKLDKTALITTRPISKDRAVVLVATGGFPWQGGPFGLFLVNPASGALIKSIITFDQVYNAMPDLKTAGPGYVTVVQEDADSGNELDRKKYFFDELSTAPATSQSYKPVRITAITRFKSDMYFMGQKSGNGVIIRLGLKNDKPAPGDWEMIDNIGGEKISPITFSKIESDGLRMYTPSETYAFDGKAWSRMKGPDTRYFRPAKDPCADISFDAISKDFTLYEKCDKERHTQGDAALVGYEGRCETDNPGEYAWLYNSYTGVLERHAISARLIDVDKKPLRRFLIWSTDAYYDKVHQTGIYEIKSDSCKFYPMPMPDKDILKRYRPDKNGCGLNDKLGPYQKLGDRIWFCKNFYGGEGECGVGAAGFFDTKAKVFEILYSSQTAKWSCSALLAEEKTVWMGLEHIGEGWGSFGGLAAVDIASGDTIIHEVPSGISAIQRMGDSIILGTGEGIYLLNPGGVASFMGPDVDKDGQYSFNFSKAVDFIK